MAKGMPNAIAVMAVADRGAMYDPSAVFYMEKLATGPAAADVVDITAPVAENIRRGRQGQEGLASATSPSASSTARGTSSWSQEVREAGARIKFITDGDVAGAIAAAREGTGVDLLLGIGGTPEGIIAACALKCMGGALQGKLWPQGRRGAAEGARRRPRPRPGAAHRRPGAGGDVFFVATGITDGELLRGVQYRAGGCTTQSLVMRSRVGHHPLDRQPALAGEAARLLRRPLRRRRRADDRTSGRRRGHRRRQLVGGGGGIRRCGQPVQQRPHRLADSPGARLRSRGRRTPSGA